MLLLALLAAAPADSIPSPRAERCIPFDADPAEGETAVPNGLSYEQVRGALNKVIQHALKCARPSGMDAVYLTYELVVGCDGVVRSVTVADDGGAPATYVSCVQGVVAKADFPAHDYADGFPVTYPVNVSW